MYGLTIHWDLGFTHIDKLFFKLDNDLTMIWGFQGVLLINGPLWSGPYVFLEFIGFDSHMMIVIITNGFCKSMIARCGTALSDMIHWLSPWNLLQSPGGYSTPVICGENTGEHSKNWNVCHLRNIYL